MSDPLNGGDYFTRVAENEAGGVQITNRRSRALTGKCSIAGHEVLLAKPETYMNLSGIAVGALVAELGIDAAFDATFPLA